MDHYKFFMRLVLFSVSLSLSLFHWRIYLYNQLLFLGLESLFASEGFLEFCSRTTAFLKSQVLHIISLKIFTFIIILILGDSKTWTLRKAIIFSWCFNVNFYLIFNLLYFWYLFNSLLASLRVVCNFSQEIISNLTNLLDKNSCKKNFIIFIIITSYLSCNMYFHY